MISLNVGNINALSQGSLISKAAQLSAASSPYTVDNIMKQKNWCRNPTVSVQEYDM